MSNHPRPEITDRTIVELYRTGLTTYEVARALDMSQPTVVFRLKRANEPRRTRWQHHADKSKDEAFRLYKSGLNSCEVARIVGVTPAAVRAVVRQRGMKIRQVKGKQRSGPDNPSWKGGRFKGVDGYIWISIGGKRRAPEHRLIMERHLGRALTNDEIVHHLNGIRDDNRIENLTVTTRKHHEHYTYVKSLQQRVRDLEQLIR